MLKKRNIISLLAGLICVITVAAVYFGGNILGEFRNGVATDSKGIPLLQRDFVRVMDVGQGDSILIYSNGRSALIDTGTVASGNELCYELNGICNNTLDVMLLSHLHSDHTGGVNRILEDFDIKNLILPELSTFSEGLSAAQNAINAVNKTGGEIYGAKQGMNFSVGDFEVTVLAAYGDMDDENNRSIIVMAEIDGRKFLFTGDAEKQVEKELIKEKINIDCDVLKLGHHGSTTSTCIEFLNAATPEYAAISVGADNMYGHPHKEVIASLEKRNIKILRTDESGSITFFVDNGEITTETER